MDVAIGIILNIFAMILTLYASDHLRSIILADKTQLLHRPFIILNKIFLGPAAVAEPVEIDRSIDIIDMHNNSVLERYTGNKNFIDSRPADYIYIDLDAIRKSAGKIPPHGYFDLSFIGLIFFSIVCLMVSIPLVYIGKFGIALLMLPVAFLAANAAYKMHLFSISAIEIENFKSLELVSTDKYFLISYGPKSYLFPSNKPLKFEVDRNVIWTALVACCGSDVPINIIRYPNFYYFKISKLIDLSEISVQLNKIVSKRFFQPSS